MERVLLAGWLDTEMLMTLPDNPTDLGSCRSKLMAAITPVKTLPSTRWSRCGQAAACCGNRCPSYGAGLSFWRAVKFPYLYHKYVESWPNACKKSPKSDDLTCFWVQVYMVGRLVAAYAQEIQEMSQFGSTFGTICATRGLGVLNIGGND